MVRKSDQSRWSSPVFMDEDLTVTDSKGRIVKIDKNGKRKIVRKKK